jgi:hypothetical protein
MNALRAMRVEDHMGVAKYRVHHALGLMVTGASMLSMGTRPLRRLQQQTKRMLRMGLQSWIEAQLAWCTAGEIELSVMQEFFDTHNWEGKEWRYHIVTRSMLHNHLGSITVPTVVEPIDGFLVLFELVSKMERVQAAVQVADDLAARFGRVSANLLSEPLRYWETAQHLHYEWLCQFQFINLSILLLNAQLPDYHAAAVRHINQFYDSMVMEATLARARGGRPRRVVNCPEL